MKDAAAWRSLPVGSDEDRGDLLEQTNSREKAAKTAYDFLKSAARRSARRT